MQSCTILQTIHRSNWTACSAMALSMFCDAHIQSHHIRRHTSGNRNQMTRFDVFHYKCAMVTVGILDSVGDVSASYHTIFMNNIIQHCVRFAIRTYFEKMQSSIQCITVRAITWKNRTMKNLCILCFVLYVQTKPWLVAQGLTYHKTHYRSYWGRVFTRQMTQRTVSEHRRKIGPKD